MRRTFEDPREIVGDSEVESLNDQIVKSLNNLRIAIVGSGAIGTYYGGKLAAGGNDVRFLVRSGFDEVRKRGLHIMGPDEDLRLGQVNCYRSTTEMGVSDVVLVAIKTTSNSDLIELIPPILSDQTLLLTLQNGLGNEEFLAKHFGAERVLAGLCFICLRRSAPGTVKRYDYGHINLGEYERKPSQRTHALASEFRRCGIDCSVVENLALERWRKLVWNIPFNGLSIAAGGIDTAAILADPDLHNSTCRLMDEVISGANQCGLPLEKSAAGDQLRRTQTMGNYKPSTLLDFEAGKPLEIEAIWGEPLRRGEAAQAKMPRLEQLYSVLKSLDSIRQGQCGTK
jgi:2-dehydropantoate 2-reductase